VTGAPPRVLTIAGSDSGGGAGIQADLRTLFACGVHGCVALTAVTVQNSLGVTGVSEIPADVVAAQIISVAEDIGLQAAKTGMLASAQIIEAITPALDRVGIGRGLRTPFVVDPVSASMHGDQLLADSALDALRGLLFPRATLVTPNLDEVRLITGIAVKDRADQRVAAEALHANGREFIELSGPRYDVKHTHGSGDTLASSISSALARGASVPEAVRFGKDFIVKSVAAAYPLGAGVGPVSPLWRLDK
jgi:hydroxymethylpyrimidine/phosphomethylpyrimidine kinase